MGKTALYEFLGRSWCRKARRCAKLSGNYQAARNLRKQGVGLAVALALLTGRII